MSNEEISHDHEDRWVKDCEDGRFSNDEISHDSEDGPGNPRSRHRASQGPRPVSGTKYSDTVILKGKVANLEKKVQDLEKMLKNLQ